MNRSGLAGEPVELVVVKHHRHAIGGELHVDLDPIARRNRSPDRGARVLWPPGPGIVKGAVRERQLQEGRREHGQPIWKMPSISTATPKGRLAADTAERV